MRYSYACIELTRDLLIDALKFIRGVQRTCRTRMAQSEKEAELRQWETEKEKLNPTAFLVQTVLALATTFSIFYGGYFYCPSIPGPSSDSAASRATYTLRCAFPPLLVLIAAVMMAALKRVSTPAVNPLANKEHFVLVQRNFLGNTLEQIVVWLLSTGVLVTYLSLEEMRLVPLYATTFVVGRILFRIGYPTKRTWGIMINFLSQFFVVGLTIYFMFTRGCLSTASSEVPDKLEL